MSMQLFSFGHPCEHQLRRTCIGGTSCPLNGYPDTWCCSYIKGKINFKRDKPCEGPRCRWGFSHPTQAQFDAVTQVLNESRPIAAKIDEAEDTDLLSFHIDNAHVVDTVQCALHMMRHPPSACAQRVGQLLAYAAVKTGETKVFMQLLKTMKKPVDGYILGAYAYLTQSSNPATAAAAAAGNNNSGNANATGTTKSSKKNKNNNNNSSSDGKQHGQGNDVVEDLKNDMVDLMNAALSQGGHLVNREDQHLLQAVFIQALKNYHKNNKKRMEMLEAANQKFGDRLNAKDTTKEKEKDNGKAASTAAAAAQATPVKTAAQVVSQGSNTTTKETPAAVIPAAEVTPPVPAADTTTTATNSNNTPAGTHRRTSNAKHNNAATAPNAHPSTTPSATPSTVAAESARPASAEVTTTVTNASLDKRSETNTVNNSHTLPSSAGNGHHSKTSSGPVTVSPGLSSHNAHNGTAQGKRTTLTSPPAAVATNGREGSVSPQSSLPREASSTTTTPVLTAAASRSSYPNSNTAATAPVGKTSESNRKSETTTTNHTNGNLKDNTNSPAPRLTTTTTPPVSPAPPTQSANTSTTGHQASQTPVRTSNGSHAKTSGSTSSVSHTAGRPASATVAHVASSVSSSPAPPLVSGATASLGKVSPAATFSNDMKNSNDANNSNTSAPLQATTPLPPPQPSSGTMSYTKSSIAVPATNTISPPRSSPPLPNRPVVSGISRLLELDHGAGLQAYYEPMDWAAPMPDVLLFGGQFSLRPTPAQGHATLGPAEKLRRSLHASPLPSPAAMPYNYIAAAGSSGNNNSGNRNNNRSSSVSESNGNSPGATAAAASLQPVVSAAVAAAAAQPGAMFVDNVFGTAAAEPEFDNLDPAQLFKDITESWYN